LQGGATAVARQSRFHAVCWVSETARLTEALIHAAAGF
jgi:hypothetical protein